VDWIPKDLRHAQLGGTGERRGARRASYGANPPKRPRNGTTAKPLDGHAIGSKFRLSQLPLRPPVENRNEEIHVRGRPEDGAAKWIPPFGVVLLVQ